MSPSTRAPVAWILVAHVLGAAALGALESAKLRSASLGMTLVPLFMVTGLVIGATIAGVERLVQGRPWWVAALGLAAPSLVVGFPVASTLFEGAFAQTLPLAGALPYLLPLVMWVGVAAVVALGRRVARAPDLTTRAIVILGCAGAIGAIVWVERHVLASGYPGAHVGATLAVIVFAGCAVRAGRRGTVPRYLVLALVVIVLGTASAAILDGLGAVSDRRLLATRGDQARDLVRLWRQAFDRDGDGSSRRLGGGDCDDHDAARHPGAADVPEDGIDQDCDGHDAAPPPPATAPPKALDLASWRATPAVRALLDRTRPMNVLLISVDALRADMLDPATADRTDFPRLTRLLDESVWFTRAIAPAAGTDISLGTLLTGRFDPFQPVPVTLPEAMQATGRVTSSALPVEVMRYVGETLLTRGIDRAKPIHTDWGTDDIGDHVSASATTAEGLRALDEAKGKPTFTWVHYFDVHEHHQIDVPKVLREKVAATGGKKRHTYRALLRAVDDEVGRLLDEVTARGLADSTIIVFASDHGESLGEDARLGVTHGKVTYASLVRIPIAIKIPGVPGGQRTDAVSLVDLPPTLLGLLDASSTMTLDGTDLLPAILDAPPALRATSRALVIHEELQWSVVEWPHQLIVRPADDVVELYDLTSDPTQIKDLSAKLPDVVTRLRARYAEVPEVRVDRTTEGRRWRERQAQRPRTPAPGAGSAATSRP